MSARSRLHGISLAHLFVANDENVLAGIVILHGQSRLRFQQSSAGERTNDDI